MNPYHEEEHPIKRISSDHVFSFKVMKRGDYLQYFSKKSGYAIGMVAKKLEKMDDPRTLAYIKSSCDAYEREGKGTWGRAFGGILKQNSLKQASSKPGDK